MSELKTCFVIAPIGEEGTEIRKRSDQLFKYVISPVAEAQGYRAEMAHHMSKPGSITTQIINSILDADLVIADLTGHNANVLYELAVRHVVKKPVVQMIQQGEKLPFDISGQRTIPIDHKDLDSVEEAKKALARQIESVQKDPTQVDSPISIAVDLSSLRDSEKPRDAALAEIMSLLQEIKAEQKPQSYQTSLYASSGAGALATQAALEETRKLAIRTAYDILFNKQNSDREQAALDAVFRINAQKMAEKMCSTPDTQKKNDEE